MTAPEILVLSLGLSVGVAAIAWASGRGIECVSADPRLRDAVWAVALILPVIPPLVATFVLLTPPPVREIALVAATGLPDFVVPSAVDATIARSPFTFDGTLAAWAVLLAATMLSVARLTALALRVRKLARIIDEADAPDTAMTSLVEAAARDFSIRAPRLRVSADTPGALLANLGRTQLILPAGFNSPTADTAAAHAVITHELAHLKRGDHLTIWWEEVMLALLAVNPLMPLLRTHRAAAREEACDALALGGATPATRRAYAQSLIDALACRTTPLSLPALTFTGTRRSQAMNRMNAILNPAPPAGVRYRLTAVGLGCLIALLAGAGTLAVAAERESIVRYRSVLATPAPLASAAVELAVDNVVVAREPRAGVPSARSQEEPVQDAVDTRFAQALNSLTAEQRERYRNPSAQQYQAICASSDPGDDGFCAGVMFAQIFDAPNNGVCLPASFEQADQASRSADLGELVNRGKAEIARAQVRSGDNASSLALSALARAYPCATASREGVQ